MIAEPSAMLTGRGSIQDDSAGRRPKKVKQRCDTERGRHVVPGPESNDEPMAPWWRTSGRLAFSSENAGTNGFIGFLDREPGWIVSKGTERWRRRIRCPDFRARQLNTR